MAPCIFDSIHLLGLKARTSIGAFYSSLIFFVLAVSLSTIPALAYSDEAQSIPVPYIGTSATDSIEFNMVSRYLTMSDGVKIAISVYLPTPIKENARLPTMLHQTRYWRSVEYRWPLSLIKETLPRGHIGTYAKRFIANGYAWVDVDVRGSGASFGNRPYAYTPREINDGAEIVDWIIRQPWSNGKVGAIGISYGGAAAEMLLVNQHPAVKAIAPLFSGFDLYPDLAFPGGIHLTWFTRTWTYINNQLDQNLLPFSGWLAKLLVSGVKPVDEKTGVSLLMEALQDHQANWNPHEEALGITFRDDVPPSHMTSSIDRLSARSYAKEIIASGAVIYSYSGWFDGGYPLAAIKRHLSYNHQSNKLILGPWDHGGKRNISPFNQGPSAFDHQGELLKFFDFYLKGIDTGITNEPLIHYFTMGEERWKTAPTWPPQSTQTSYYLAPDNRLLQKGPVAIAGSDRYQVDPTAGTGNQSRWDTLVGKSLTDPYPDRITQDLKLLSYTSPPLKQDVEVTGHPILTLFLSSTTADATVFAYLEDVDTQGHIAYVTEGELRALHRKLSDTHVEHVNGLPYRTFKRRDALPLKPGEVAELVFDFLPTSYQFKKGHRIRLALAGADKDHFAFISDQSRTLTIFHTPHQTSHLDLPVVP
jgi:putative CocE/NonD family hydrolase